MKEKGNNGTDFDRDEETMARLLRLAGEREPISKEIEQRVYDRVQNEWQASSRAAEGARIYPFVRREWEKRSSGPGVIRRWALPLAVAASAILAVAVVLQPPPPAPANIAVGTVAKVSGDAVQGGKLTPGRLIYPGEILSTGGQQGISLMLTNAESIRLDQNTTLVVDTRDQFTLMSGRVYADTGDFMYRDRGLVIDTTVGSVTDVGTQFAVALGDDDQLHVAVREGRVDVDRKNEQFVAVAGERMQLGHSGGATVDMLAPHDPYWDWAASLAPTFDIENKSLLDFLRWAARETGRELVFENDELRMAAMRVDLHGSVADFEPLQALESILAGTTFHYRVEPDKIVIER